MSETSLLPVLVQASPPPAGEYLLSLLSDEYGGVGERHGDSWHIWVSPIDDLRRGTIVYRVVQASLAVKARYPDSSMFLVTEDGNAWELPPPSL